jgi:RNA polymerase sigma-70 factor (ECF subfamily)
VDDRARAELDEWMRRLADGDRSVFEPTYAALWPVVRAFCRRVLPEGDADDAAQHALLKAFDRAATYETGRDALAWVLAIASWECRTIARRAHRSRGRERDSASLEVAVDERRSPEALVVEAELSRALDEALGALSPEDRATLERTMLDEAPPDVLAATFRKRRERAMVRLKAAWRRLYGDG